MLVNDYTRACSDYGRIISLDPDSEDAYRRKADCEFLLKKFPEAVSDYTLAIKHQSDPPARDFELRARVYEKMGKTDLADLDRKRASEIERKR